MTFTPEDLRKLADAVLDTLDPADADELVGRRVDRAALLDAWVALAVRAAADLARGDAEVASEQQATLLLLACLSLRPDSYGVKARADRAAETFLRFRPLIDADPRDLVQVAAEHPDEVQALVPLLTRARGIRAGLRDAGFADPPFFVEPVALAVAAAVPTGPCADAVTLAGDVLRRGATLARDHAESGRPVPAPRGVLPIIGNTDFLLRLAGYRLAMANPGAPGTLDDTLDELDRVAAQVGAEIVAAMERPTGFRARFRDAEPDVLAGVDRYVTGLGVAVGGEQTGRLLRLAYAVRTRGTRPRRVDAHEPLPVERLRVPDGTTRHAELDELAALLVAGLFERAGPHVRRPLLDWLCGRRAPDEQDALLDLLRMLRVGAYRMAEHGAGNTVHPVPTGLAPAELAAVLAHLTAAVRPDELTSDRHSDANRIVHLGLPPLWTRRRAAVRKLAADRRVLALRGDTAQRRTAFFRAGTRAPVQFFLAVSDRGTGRCCPPDAGTEPGRPPAEDLVACPHRPWGEIGVVDTYGTIAADTELSPEAVRKYYGRYAGPDRELLLGMRPKLRPEDC